MMISARSTRSDVNIEAAKASLEAIYNDVATYIMKTEEAKGIRLPLKHSAQLYLGLFDTIVGTRENWDRMQQEVEQMENADASALANIVRGHMAGVRNATKKYIREEMSAGHIQTGSIGKNTFLAGIETALNKSLGGRARE